MWRHRHWIFWSYYVRSASKLFPGILLHMIYNTATVPGGKMHWSLSLQFSHQYAFVFLMCVLIFLAVCGSNSTLHWSLDLQFSHKCIFLFIICCISWRSYFFLAVYDSNCTWLAIWPQVYFFICCISGISKFFWLFMKATKADSKCQLFVCTCTIVAAGV